MPAKTSIWRWASIQPSIPIFPGLGVSPYAFLPLLVWFFWWSWITFYIAIGAFVLAVILAKMGFTLDRFLAWVQHRLRGSRIYARPWWYRNRYSPAEWQEVGRWHSELSYDDDGDID